MDLVLISLPAPKDPPNCYLSHFTSLVHERKDGKVLIDFPLGLDPDYRERRWIPEKFASKV